MPDLPAKNFAAALSDCRRALPALMLIAWALNIYFYSGYYMSDDWSYLDGIQQLAAFRAIDPTNLAHLRLMVILPAAAVYALSGSSILLTTLSYTLYHPLLVALVYWIGRLSFEPKTALLGATLVALSPIYYVFGGAILPDNCSCLWLAALLAALLWGLRDRAAAERLELRELGFWCGVGLLNGIAYSVKETGLVFALPVGLAILIGRLRQGARWRAFRSAAAFGVGLFAFFLIETVTLRLLSGSWVLRLTAGVGSDQQREAMIDLLAQQGISPAQRLAFWYSRDAKFFSGLGIALIVAANVVAPWLCRRRLRQTGGLQLAILTAFWLWPFVYLTLGTTSYRQYLPPPLQARYFSICVAPAFLITGAVLLELLERLSERLFETRVGLRRLLDVVPFALAGIWALALFVRVEPDSASIYRAPQTKAALAAFQDARLLRPDLRVVLSSYLGQRLEPLLHSPGCSACGQIVARVDTLEHAPPRPFVAMMSGRNDSLGPAMSALQRAHQIELQPLGRGTYQAPLGRRAELRAALYPLLGELAAPVVPLAPASFAVSLYLVSDAH